MLTCVLLSHDSSAVDLPGQETASRARSVALVQEVAGQDEKRAEAHGVGGAAVHLGPVAGVVRDPAQVLQVLRVPEERGADDLVLHRAAELGEGVADDGSALTLRELAHNLLVQA